MHAEEVITQLKKMINNTTPLESLNPSFHWGEHGSTCIRGTVQTGGLYSVTEQTCSPAGLEAQGQATHGTGTP